MKKEPIYQQGNYILDYNVPFWNILRDEKYKRIYAEEYTYFGHAKFYI